jgi:kinesin family protein 2/24
MKKQYGENNLKKGGIAEEIALLKQRREARKAKEEQKKNPQVSSKDAAFSKMVSKKKESLSNNQPNKHITAEDSKIFVVVRKRPRSQKEINNGDIDCISVINPRTIVHECKVQVDGITKYIEDHEFYFDNSFNENDDTNVVYKYTISPIINLILNQGIVTCFAYGQTGSGKTYTMKGIENLSIDDLFSESTKLGDKFDFYISFFEIYGGRLFDLLNNKNKLQVLDDKNGKVQIYGLITQQVDSKEQMHKIIEAANAIRITHNTVTNETSSRSHAICNIIIKKKGSDEEYGKLSLVDLAGSERAQETQSNNRQRRAEGAEINKSLLALKECIRALDEKKTNPDTHVPFRASKLTHVLRDSFVSKSDKSKIIMISCVSPTYTSANHTLNTLRYSDRLKEQTKQHFGGNYNNVNNGRGINQNGNNNNNLNNNINHIPSPKNNNKNETNSNKANINKANNKIMKTERSRSKGKKQTNKKEEPKIKQNKNNNKNERIPTQNEKNEENDNKYIDDGEEEDWDYLKRTMAKRDGKIMNDDFIKYNHLTAKLVEDEDDIINYHMNIIKEDARLLSQEGDLITNIKGVGKEGDFKMDEYIAGLDKIIEQKLKIYNNIKGKVDKYKLHIKEEDELRQKLDPKFFMDNN